MGSPPRVLAGTAGARDRVAIDGTNGLAIAIASQEPQIKTCVLTVGLRAPFAVKRAGCLDGGESFVESSLSPNGRWAAVTTQRNGSDGMSKMEWRLRVMSVTSGRVVLDEAAEPGMIVRAISDDVFSSRAERAASPSTTCSPESGARSPRPSSSGIGGSSGAQASWSSYAARASRSSIWPPSSPCSAAEPPPGPATPTDACKKKKKNVLLDWSASWASSGRKAGSNARAPRGEAWNIERPAETPAVLFVDRRVRAAPAAPLLLRGPHPPHGFPQAISTGGPVSRETAGRSVVGLWMKRSRPAVRSRPVAADRVVDKRAPTRGTTGPPARPIGSARVGRTPPPPGLHLLADVPVRG